jgi:hypothetical protein
VTGSAAGEFREWCNVPGTECGDADFARALLKYADARELVRVEREAFRLRAVALDETREELARHAATVSVRAGIRSSFTNEEVSGRAVS